MILYVSEGIYSMKATLKKTSEDHIKPITVRLPTKEARVAFEKYCLENHRSLDGQASMLILRVLKKQGYIK